jgi:putative tryptophan/tyrosine transport system substrate-binding protein
MRRRTFIAGLAGAAVLPFAAHGQAATPVVGVLSPESEGPVTAKWMAGLLQGLSERQYVPGQNFAIEYRWAEGNKERLSALADDLVRRQVAVIVAPGQEAALAARTATTTIPIVFNVAGDPIKFGLVTGVKRPGGNATGISLFASEIEAKRLGLLQEMVPRARLAGLLVNPDNTGAESQAREVQDSARVLGLKLQVGLANSDAGIDAAFEGWAKAGTQAVMAAADPYLASCRQQLVALAARHNMPAMWEAPDFVEDGGLMSYGASVVDTYRQLGVYAGRILKGEKPARLPVLRPLKFELAVNLKTAKALGIEVSPILVARADMVVK